MGTFVEIQVFEPKMEAKTVQHAIEKAMDEIEGVSRIMSSFDVKSDISRVNAEAGRKWVSVNPKTIEVLNKALRLSEMSDGVYDISVGRILELWGFSGNGQRDIPEKKEIETAMLGVGFEKVSIDEENNRVKFKNLYTKIDLGSIAKGYAVDLAACSLKRSGIKNALVNAGGDIYSMGSNKDGHGWVVGIRHPKEKNEIIGTLAIKDKAVVTSGNYENFFIKDGEKYSHIIDPGTGYPVENNIVSVTVVSFDTATADGLATMIAISGANKGLEIVKALKDTECIIIMEHDNNISFRSSEGLKDIIIPGL